MYGAKWLLNTTLRVNQPVPPHDFRGKFSDEQGAMLGFEKFPVG